MGVNYIVFRGVRQNFFFRGEGSYDIIVWSVNTYITETIGQIMIAYHSSDSALSLSLIHISEPTRPLYISYAVFCLKKKIVRGNSEI